METILIFIVVFAILVILHEFGHYYAAKKAGILVREFAVGFGPKLVSFRKDETTFTIRLLPMGGYVRMAGYEEETVIRPGMPLTISLNKEEQVDMINLSSKKKIANGIPFELISEDLEKELYIEGNINGNPDQRKRFDVSRTALIVEEDGTEVQIAPLDRQFQSATVLERILTNFAGPFMNLILAIFTFTVLAFMQGGVLNNEPVIGDVLADSPAAVSGIQAGDRVEEINGESIEEWMDMVLYIQERPNETLDISVLKEDGSTEQVEVTTKAVAVETGEEIGQIGIQASMDHSFLSKVMYGFTETWNVTKQIVGSIVSMFTGGFSIDMFGGPVAIYATTEAVAQTGLFGIINWLAILSINLFIINLLPIPALDGAKILLNIVEGIRGKPISEEKEGIITLIGAGLLLLLMVAVTWNDIQRFFF